MTALEKLQEKIEEWKYTHESIQEENQTLQKEIESLKSFQLEAENLRRELSEKDSEIEKIIKQVEALLT